MPSKNYLKHILIHSFFLLAVSLSAETTHITVSDNILQEAYSQIPDWIYQDRHAVDTSQDDDYYKGYTEWPRFRVNPNNRQFYLSQTDYIYNRGYKVVYLKEDYYLLIETKGSKDENHVKLLIEIENGFFIGNVINKSHLTDASISNNMTQGEAWREEGTNLHGSLDQLKSTFRQLLNRENSARGANYEYMSSDKHQRYLVFNGWGEALRVNIRNQLTEAMQEMKSGKDSPIDLEMLAINRVLLQNRIQTFLDFHKYTEFTKFILWEQLQENPTLFMSRNKFGRYLTFIQTGSKLQSELQGQLIVPIQKLIPQFQSRSDANKPLPNLPVLLENKQHFKKETQSFLSEYRDSEFESDSLYQYFESDSVTPFLNPESEDKLDQYIVVLINNESYRRAINTQIIQQSEKYTALSDEHSPFTIAANKGELEQVQQLLDQGVDPNSHYNNWTGLNQAAQDGQLEIVKTLMAAGADTKVRTKKNDPLITAVRHGRANVVEYLISNGADLESRIYETLQTPLMLASEYNYSQIVTLLLAKGADVDALDINGSTSLDWAKHKENTEIVSLLEEAIERQDPDYGVLNGGSEWDWK